MSDHSFETAIEGPVRGIQRKATPYRRSPTKRTRLSEGDHPTTSEDSLGQVNREVREDEEGLLKRKRKIDILKDEARLASCSTDTVRENCNTSVEELKRKGLKRKADEDGESPDRKTRRITNEKTKKEPTQYLRVAQIKAEFKAKYKQLYLLGEGGYGAVFAGYRKADYVQVAIKHIAKDSVLCKEKDANGKLIAAEVAVMLKLGVAARGEVGTSGSVSLLDWYDLDRELILVLERPVPSMDLFVYMERKSRSLLEEEAKVIMKQLVDAAIELHNNHIFHRDIKLENILIETGSDVLRLRLIDFGVSCFFKENSCFHKFLGTADYAPPELIYRGIYKPGPTTVWQIGAILFEMLQNSVRFHTNLFLRKILKINNKMSKDCQDFQQKCLTQNPKRRATLDQLKLHPWLT